jgi:hypothetical protein
LRRFATEPHDRAGTAQTVRTCARHLPDRELAEQTSK